MKVVDARRARRWFWSLTVVAILAAGGLSRALTSESSPGTGLLFAGSGMVLAISVTLAGRVLLAMTRSHPDRDQSGG